MNNFELAKEYFLRGCAFLEAGDFFQAESNFISSLELIPDRASTLTNLSVAQLKLKKYSEAKAAAKKAILVEVDNSEAYLNLGLVEKELRAYDDAVKFFDKALSLKPDYHEAWSNKGVALHELKLFNEAIVHYDKALSLKPDYHEASWNKSLSLLIQGDFENGLPLYESRWAADKVSEVAGKRLFDRPTWLGVESLQGKTILLYGEQGLGDFIQFARYAKLVADLGATVILEAPQVLAGLLENLEGVSQLVIKGKKLPYFDYQCPLLSLPWAFNTNISSIPAHIPYLVSSAHQAAEWKRKLGKKEISELA